MPRRRGLAGLLAPISALILGQACSSPGPVDGSGGGATASGGAGSGGAPVGSGGGPLGTGGAVGSGGSAPAGGAPGVGGGSGGALPGSGGAGSGGTGGSSVILGCTEADLFCFDFEDVAAGSKPSGAPWQTSSCSDQTYQASVTAGSGRDGSQGYVTSGASTGTNYCALVADIGTPSEFWVRAWIKIGGSDPDAEHEVTFFELGPSTSDDPELRIGYRGDSSCPNNGAAHQGFELGATQGPGGEYTGCTGNKPVADEWYCLEVHVDQAAGTSLIADLYVDSVQQDYLVHSMEQTEVLGNFGVSYLKVGMQSYGGAFGELVVDDLSVSTSRLACPAK